MELFICINGELDKIFDLVIIKLGNLLKMEYIVEKVSNVNLFLVNFNEYFILFGDLIDLIVECVKIEEELNYVKGFL